MNRLLTATGLLLLTACSKPEGKPQQSEEPIFIANTNNIMTRHGDGLQQDVQKAHNAVDKMNRGVEKSERQVGEGQ